MNGKYKRKDEEKLTASSTVPYSSNPWRRDSSVVCQDRPLFCVSLEGSDGTGKLQTQRIAWPFCRKEKKRLLREGDELMERGWEGESVVRGKRERGRKREKERGKKKKEILTTGKKRDTVGSWEILFNDLPVICKKSHYCLLGKQTSPWQWLQVIEHSIPTPSNWPLPSGSFNLPLISCNW